MQERRTLGYLSKEDIPSSAVAWDGSTNTSPAGNVFYIPIGGNIGFPSLYKDNKWKNGFCVYCPYGTKLWINGFNMSDMITGSVSYLYFKAIGSYSYGTMAFVVGTSYNGESGRSLSLLHTLIYDASSKTLKCSGGVGVTGSENVVYTKIKLSRTESLSLLNASSNLDLYTWIDKPSTYTYPIYVDTEE